MTKDIDIKKRLEIISKKKSLEKLIQESNIKKAKLEKVFNADRPNGLSDKTRTPSVIVSLTSYPQRMYDIHYCLMSLLNQTIKPDMVILWLGEEQFPNKEKDIPDEVIKLQENGLTIKWTKDIKSYKKLIPALQEYPNDIIITADDDILYPEDWFEKLYNSYDKKNIICHRAHKIKIKNGRIKPYETWDKCIENNLISFFNFPTTGGGVLYPPKSLYKEVFNEELFMKLAPMADDIWFWAMAVIAGTKIKVVETPINNITCVNLEREYGLNGETTLFQENRIKNDIQLNNVIKHYPVITKKLISEKLRSFFYSALNLIAR